MISGVALWTRIQRSSVTWTVATQAVAAGLSLVSSPLLARAVGANGRGDVAALMTTLSMVSWIGFLGLPHAAGFFSFIPRNRTVLVTATMASSLGALAAAGLWVSAPTFAKGHDELTIDALRAGALLLPFIGTAQCGQEILYAQNRLVAWNLLRSVPLVGPATSVILLFLLDALDLRTALTVNLAWLVVWATAGSWLAVRHSGRSPVLAAEFKRVRQYAFQRWLAISSEGLLSRLDQLIMVPLSAPSELGRYAVAVTIAASANLLSTAIGMVGFARARSHQLAGTDADWRALRRRSLVFGVCSGLVVLVTGPYLIPLLFGPDFNGLFPVLLGLVVAQILGALWLLDSNVLHGQERSGETLGPSWVATVFVAASLVVLGLDGELTALEAATVSALGAALRALTFRLWPRRSRAFTPAG